MPRRRTFELSGLVLAVTVLFMTYPRPSVVRSGAMGDGGAGPTITQLDSVKPLSDPKGDWKLRADLSDEFNGSGLDTAKWEDAVRSWGSWSWDTADVVVRGGSLHLRMTYAPHMQGGELKYYTSGIVMSRSTVRYGYVEARIRGAERFPGVAPAFWLRYPPDSSGERTEIDVVELTQRNEPRRLDTNTHVLRHIGLTAPLHEEVTWTAPFDPRSAYHTYGCEWSGRQIRWYVDGQLVRVRNNDYWDQRMVVILSMGLRKPLTAKPSAIGFPTEMQVDYVRVWQRPSGR